MAGLAAGVVTASDVNSPSAQPSKAQRSLANPATWSYIWTGAAAFYLIGIYVGMIRVGGEM